MQTDPFKEYLKQQEPDKKYKGYAWQTAIGLQAVDGLKPSEYLVDAAIQNIEGKITLDEVKNLLDVCGVFLLVFKNKSKMPPPIRVTASMIMGNKRLSISSSDFYLI